MILKVTFKDQSYLAEVIKQIAQGYEAGHLDDAHYWDFVSEDNG